MRLKAFNLGSKYLNYLLMLSTWLPSTEAIFFTNNHNNQTEIVNIRKLDENFSKAEGHKHQISQLDVLRGGMRMLRDFSYSMFNEKRAFKLNKRLGKIQEEIPAETPFPCDLTYARSATPPKTVHELRPGDIDIIAVMGDSMSAGTCLMTENFLGVTYENRGMAFSGGGVSTWRKFLTLPNILKVFNPKLYGYSVADGFTFYETSRFNVAEPVGMSRDLVYQAKLLIQRMRQDPHVDFQRHWKLLTIFVGNVDFCTDYCHYEDVAVPLRFHEEDLRQSLTLLRDYVPRLYVNLISAPDSIRSFRSMKLSLPCYVIHRMFCTCVYGANYTAADLREYSKKIRLWQDVDAYVASLPEFNTDNFTVIYHDFLRKPEPPRLPNGDVDQRYFAADCFHFSQLGHALFATTLWNSMLQAEGFKPKSYCGVFENFQCPSLKRPFLATRKNSF